MAGIRNVHTHLVIVLLAILCLATCFALTACKLPAQTSSSPSSVSPNSSDEPITTDLEERYAVLLDYNAGTGYEWVCTVEPEDIFDIIGTHTENMSDSKESTTGGPMRDYVNIIARAPGKATLTCELKRSWEDEEPAEVQTFVFEVNGGLGMTFIPEESSYVNEPVETFSA